nr:glycosyltransferase family 39 protein [Bifidobacterium miconisargentati]
MERFPYQVPFVLFLRLMQTVFGSNAYVAVELVNSLCSAAAGYLLIRYAMEVFGNEAANVTAVLTICFLPAILYTTFAYGNIPAMPFAIGALLVQYRYFQNQRFRTALLSAILVTISIMFKSTMVVVLIAMCLVWLISCVTKRQWKNLAATVASLVIYAVCTSGLNAAVARKYDVVTNDGLPKIAWIAMGLHTEDYPDITDIPGRYDGFVWTWQGDDYDTTTATQDSKAALKQTWEHFTSDPAYAVRFMGRKLLFIWTDPLYESILESNWSTEGPRKPGAMASRPMTRVLHSVYYGKLNTVILSVADVVQLLTFLGVVVLLISKRKQLHVEQMVPVIACLGMVLIYIFWEAKPQYALPVGWLMIAYAGCGLDVMADRGAQWVEKFTAQHKKNGRIGA